MSKQSIIKDDKKRIFGNRLRKSREQKRLSQPAVIDLMPYSCRVSLSTFSKYEAGITAPSNTDILQALADVLGVSISYLAGDSAFRNGRSEICNSVNYKEYDHNKYRKEVYSTRLYIAYVNAFYSSIGDCNGVYISEIYDVGKTLFYVEVNHTKDCGLQIKMEEKEISTAGYTNDEELEARIQSFFLGVPMNAPDGSDNYKMPIVSFNKEDVPEEQFLVYLSEAEHITHYIQIHHRHFSCNDYIYKEFIVDFEAFVEQVSNMYSTFADVLALANLSNQV